MLFQFDQVYQNFSVNLPMLESPFLQEVHVCKGVMKKLRKKIYKFNINKQSHYQKEESTIRDALTVLEKRNLPQFLKAELEKYSDLTFSSLSGFSLTELKPLSEITHLTTMQEQQIFGMYHKNKRTIKKRRTLTPSLKLNKRPTTVSTSQQISSTTSILQIFDQQDNNDSSCSSGENSSQSQQLFGVLGNSNSLDQDYHDGDAMFQSTMLDFGNQIQMDSEEFLFKY